MQKNDNTSNNNNAHTTTTTTKKKKLLPPKFISVFVVLRFASFYHTIILLGFDNLPIRWGPYDTYSSGIDQTEWYLIGATWKKCE